MDEAITVEGVYKDFLLPHQRPNSLKSLFTGSHKSSISSKEIQHALRDISFSVKQGEFFGIVGRNGSGKSTLLKILANIYQPTKGKVTTRGRLVPFIELGVGFNPELTGRENVYLNGAMLGFSRKDVDAMYKDIVEFAELERFMDQKLKNYSSGMQVRLAFSMATRSEADILLVDEVLAVGDADFQRKCFLYFRQLKKNKKTVIFVSHDMEAVREYCDRCIMIDESELVYEGSPTKAAEKYLQLFNDSAMVQQVRNDSRWGDGAAKYQDLSVNLKGDKLIINASALFYKDLEEPVFGVLIKNSSGVTICGTNNKILQKKVGEVKQGASLQLNWQVPNIFTDDNYTVEVAITYPDGVTQADWWHEAAIFSVKNAYSTPHIVSPKIELAIN